MIDDNQRMADAPQGRRFRGPRSESAASPDGQWSALFKEHNVYLRDTESHEEFALSDDGTSEDEYSGEFYWSGDSKKLVVLRTKKGDDRKVYYIESSPKDQVQPKLHSYDYLKPGDKIPLSKPQLFDVAGRKHIAVSDELFPNPWSVTDVHWDPDSSRFTFLYNHAGTRSCGCLPQMRATGKVQTVVDEQCPTFIDYTGKQFLRCLDESGEIIWMSERDGWNHLYLYDAKMGSVKNQITTGRLGRSQRGKSGPGKTANLFLCRRHPARAGSVLCSLLPGEFRRHGLDRANRGRWNALDQVLARPPVFHRYLFVHRSCRL